MASLVSISELSVWTREEIEPDDAFALAVLDAVSLRVRSTAKQPLWEATTVPPEAKLIAILVAKRTYLNPDGVIAEGNTGPIGGDRYIEEMAQGLNLTERETSELEKFISPTDPTRSGGLWVLPITRGPVETPLYLYDGAGDWAIPYLDPSSDPYYWPTFPLVP